MVTISRDVFKRRIRDVLRQSEEEAAGVSVPAGLQRCGPPIPVETIPLLEIRDDAEFVSEAYRRILGRAPDGAGRQGYLQALQKGLPRKHVVRLLADSDEARREGSRSSSDRHHNGGPTIGFRHLSKAWVSIFVGGIRRALALRHAEGGLASSLNARADQLSEKIDSSLWTISSKLDAYAANLAVLLQKQQSALLSQGESIENRIQDLACQIGSLQQTSEASIRLQQKIGSQFETVASRAEVLLHRGISSIDGLREKLELLKNLSESQEALNRAILSLLAKSANDTQEFNRNLVSELAEIKERHWMLKQWVSEQASEVQRKFDGAFEYWASRGAAVTTCELNGFIIGAPIDDWRMAAYHRFRGAMEPGLVNLFRNFIKPGMTVVDVGANVGVLTLEAARLVGSTGRVFSFEPTPRTFEILTGNIQLNGYLESGIILARQIALLDQEGTATLYLCRGNCGHNSLYNDERFKEFVEVKTERLDYALASVHKVDIIKIDAEGAEYKILRGAQELLSRNRNIRVIIEFAPVHLRRAGIEAGEVLEEIEALGLRTYRVDDLTGEAVAITAEELLKVESVNLLLEGAHKV